MTRPNEPIARALEMPVFRGDPTPPPKSRFRYDPEQTRSVYWFRDKVQKGTPPYVCCVSVVEHGRTWTAAAAELFCAALAAEHGFAPTETPS